MKIFFCCKKLVKLYPRQWIGEAFSTFTVFVWYLFLQIGYETLQFILPNKTLMDGKSLSIGGGETDPPFSFLVLLHVGLWVVIFISDRTLQYLHHQSQARGYLEFFRETKELRRFPHYVLSTGMTLTKKLSFLRVCLLIIDLKSLTILCSGNRMVGVLCHVWTCSNIANLWTGRSTCM